MIGAASRATATRPVLNRGGRFTSRNSDFQMQPRFNAPSLARKRGFFYNRQDVNYKEGPLCGMKA